MRVFVCILFHCSCISQLLLAQSVNGDQIKRSTLFAEFAGNGIVYSLNFDHIFYSKSKLKATGGVGLSYEAQGSPHIITPIYLSGLYGMKHHVELGFGYTLLFSLHKYLGDYYAGRELEQHHHVFIPRIGYRFQKPDGGLMYRAAITPVVESDFKFISPWIGLSIGYTFKKKNQIEAEPN